MFQSGESQGDTTSTCKMFSKGKSLETESRFVVAGGRGWERTGIGGFLFGGLKCSNIRLWLSNSVNLLKKKKIIELYTQKNEHYSTKIVTQ